MASVRVYVYGHDSYYIYVWAADKDKVAKWQAPLSLYQNPYPYIKILILIAKSLSLYQNPYPYS
jgi:hypothetical protein